MKMKSMVLLAVAAGCGLIAMLGVQQVLSKDNGSALETAQVLVAVAEIGPGAVLDDTNVAFKDYPLNMVPEGVVTKLEEYEERALKGRAVPGEMIMLAKLSEKGQFGASATIPDGMRVVSVSVNQTLTHSGQILPDDRVDVIVTYRTTTPEHRTVSKTKTVLEYIQVFATDSIRDVSGSENGEVNAKNISLLVTPEQANLLMLAKAKGDLTLALRSKTDSTAAGHQAVDESMFDDAMAGHGGRTQEPQDETGESPQTGNVQEFLREQQQQDDSVETVADVDTSEPPKNVWKMEIYAGEELRIEEIELPEEEPEEDTGSLKGLFRNFFSRSNVEATQTY